MEETEQKTLSRREVVSLAGIAAALGAGLGVARSADGQEITRLQHKGAPILFLKFYSAPDSAGKQLLLGSLPVPPMLQYKFQEAAGSRVQMKIELVPTAGALLPAVKTPVVVADSYLQIKQTIKPTR